MMEEGQQGDQSVQENQSPTDNSDTMTSQAPADNQTTAENSTFLNTEAAKGFENDAAKQEADASKASAEADANSNKLASTTLEFPGPDAPPEQFEDFYRAIGKPETPADYEFTRPEYYPETLDYSDDRANQFAEVAHKLNLSKAQADGLFEHYHKDMVMKESEAIDALIEQEENETRNNLQKDWGQDYEKNLARGRMAVISIAGQEKAEEIFNNPLLASNEDFLRFVVSVGDEIGDDSLAAVVHSGGTFGKAAASQKLAELESNPAFMQRYMAGEKAAVDQFLRLHEAIFK